MEYVTYEEFKKMDIRLGTIQEVEPVPDTDKLLKFMIDFNEKDILSLFIPNTYEFYWTVTPERLVKRMISEHHIFWSKNDRLEKANQKGLTPKQVYTIASIVDKETILENEKAVIAGVYLNRINMGMKLQADPTVVFALGQFGLQRVLL